MIILTILYVTFFGTLFFIGAALSIVPVYAWKRIIQGMTHDGATFEMKQMFRYHFQVAKHTAMWLPRKILAGINRIPVIGPVITLIIFLIASIHFMICHVMYVTRLNAMESGQIRT